MNGKPSSPEDTVHKVLAVYRALRRYSKQAHSSGITGRQIACLRYLQSTGPVKMGELAKYLFIGRSSASELIDKLQQTGLVTRTRSSEDNRKVYVDITNEGRSAVKSVPLGGVPLLREKIPDLEPTKLQIIDRAFTEIAALIELEEF
jgi:DNA-binding MarR family transcriptional regulator